MGDTLEILVKAPSGNYIAARLRICSRMTILSLSTQEKDRVGHEEAANVFRKIRDLLVENKIPHEALDVNMGDDVRRIDQLRLLFPKKE